MDKIKITLPKTFEEEVASCGRFIPDHALVILAYKIVKSDKAEEKRLGPRYFSRYVRAAMELLKKCNGSLEKSIDAIFEMDRVARGKFNWNLSTVSNKFEKLKRGAYEKD